MLMLHTFGHQYNNMVNNLCLLSDLNQICRNNLGEENYCTHSKITSQKSYSRAGQTVTVEKKLSFIQESSIVLILCWYFAFIVCLC